MYLPKPKGIPEDLHDFCLLGALRANPSACANDVTVWCTRDRSVGVTGAGQKPPLLRSRTNIHTASVPLLESSGLSSLECS